MKTKRWIKLFFSLVFTIATTISLFNYIIDPYDFYDTDSFSLVKVKQSSIGRLLKAVTVSKIGPKSIILGTSRGEFGYNPNHDYFIKPTYNLSVSASTMYEASLYFKQAMKQGNLKQVLLVADNVMFYSTKQKHVQEFETYFNKNRFLFLLSLKAFKDSISTISKNIKSKKSCQRLYNKYGQKSYEQCHIDKMGGILKAIKKEETKYSIKHRAIYIYKDTKRNPFNDFDTILKLCYENDIKLKIIFGPSHVRLWEALDHSVGYSNWLQWKKDVVYEVEKIAKNYNKKPFSVYDFSTYNQFTTEKVPSEKNATMKWYWESSHYKSALGTKVLNVLNEDEKYNNFGVKLNTSNIDDHLETQKKNREKWKKKLEKYTKEVL